MKMVPTDTNSPNICIQCNLPIDSDKSIQAHVCTCAAQEAPDSILQAGTIAFGKFEILEYIAAGGKARVYRARDQLLDHVVALKLLISKTSDKDLVRFQTEARTSSKFKHKNIATIYDFGVSGSIPWLSMEFIEGPTLEQIFSENNTLPLDDFLDIFMQLAQGLQHAHNQGVLHRDIKPDNIAIAQDKDGLIPKILDFGIAKQFDLTDAAITPTGDFIGSPFYVSPEQSRGLSTSPKSDCYSLGCVMWQSLAGRPPFCGETILETVSFHQTKEPEHLIDDLHLTVPIELAATIDKMLRKDPSDRPDLSEVGEALSSIGQQLDKESTPETEAPNSGSASSGFFRLSDWRWYTMISLAILCLCALAFSILRTWLPNNKATAPPKPPHIVEKPYPMVYPALINDSTELTGDHLLTEEELKTYLSFPYINKISLRACPITEDAFSTLAKWPRLNDLNLTSTSVKDLEGLETLKNLESLSLDSTEVTDASLKHLAKLKKLETLYLNRTKVSDAGLPALASLKQLINLSLAHTQVSGITIQSLADTNLANVDVQDSDNIKAEGVRVIANLPSMELIRVSGCKNLDPSALEKIKDDYPLVMFDNEGARLPKVYKELEVAVPKKNSKLFKDKLAKYNRMLGSLKGRRDQEEVCKKYLQLCQLLISIGMLKEAEAPAIAAFELADQHNFKQLAVSSGTTVLNLLGPLHSSQGKRWANRVLATTARFTGSDSKELAECYFMAGCMYRYTLDWRNAERALKASLAINLAKRPSGVYSYSLYANTVLHLGEVYRGEGRYDDADKQYLKSLDILRNHIKRDPFENPIYCSIYNGLCETAISRFDYVKANEYNKKSFFYLQTLDKGYRHIALSQKARILEFGPSHDLKGAEKAKAEMLKLE